MGHEPKLGPKLVFCYFIKFASLVFCEITCGDSLQQCLTSNKSKTHKKIFGAQIWIKQAKIVPKIIFFYHFLKFSCLVFFEITYNDRLQQCLTCRQSKTHKKKWRSKFGPNGPKSGPKLVFFFHFLKFGLLVFP